MLTLTQIKEIELNIKNKRIGIIGDFCADIYWHADMTLSELSRETPHYPLPVVNERVYPGAGGNVAANLAALKPKAVTAVTLMGDDWRGMLLQDCLKKHNIDTSLAVKDSSRYTNAYCKPIRKGISALEYEDPRLDFDNYLPVSPDTEQIILNNLSSLAQNTDIICVADQFRYGIITEKVRDTLIKLSKSGKTVIVDSRYNISKYTDCILKPNEVECWRAVYNNEKYKSATRCQIIDAAVKLAKNNNSTVFCTLGAQGSVVASNNTLTDINAVKVNGELDICGAGDTSLSAFTSALAAGYEYSLAAEFAGMASAVTVQKIGVTGTVSFSEIAALAK